MPQPKTTAEIRAKLRELLHRAMQKFIEQGLTPQPENCRHAPIIAGKVQPCPKCMANPGQPCRQRIRFEQRYTYEELKARFRKRAGQHEWVVRNLRDVAMLLWVSGQMDASHEPDPPPLPDYLREERETAPPAWMHLDGNTLILSPEVAALFASFLEKLRERMPSAHESLERGTLGGGPPVSGSRPGGAVHQGHPGREDGKS